MNNQEAIDELKKYKVGFGEAAAVRFDRIVSVINKIHEPQKVVIPKFIGDLIEELKIGEYTIGEIGACVYDDEEQKWIDDNEELFYRAFLDGFEVEQDKLYTVEVVGTGQYLVERYKKQGYVFIDTEDPLLFTKAELEQAGFGWVFDCDGVKVEEVKND